MFLARRIRRSIPLITHSPVNADKFELRKELSWIADRKGGGKEPKLGSRARNCECVCDAEIRLCLIKNSLSLLRPAPRFKRDPHLVYTTNIAASKWPQCSTCRLRTESAKAAKFGLIFGPLRISCAGNTRIKSFGNTKESKPSLSFAPHHGISRAESFAGNFFSDFHVLASERMGLGILGGREVNRIANRTYSTSGA